MSLRPGRRDSPSGARSRSRSRSHSHVRAPSGSLQQSEVRTQTITPGSSSSYTAARLPSPAELAQGARYGINHPSTSSNTSSTTTASAFPTMASPSAADESAFTMGDYTDLPPEERPGYVPPSMNQPQTYRTTPVQYAQPAQGITYTATPQQSTASRNATQYNYTSAAAQSLHQGSGAPGLPVRTPSGGAHGQQAAAAGYQYAQGNIRYTAKPVTAKEQAPAMMPQLLRNTSSSRGQPYDVQQPFPGILSPPSPGAALAQQGRKHHNVVEVVPGGSKSKKSTSPPGLRPHSKSVSGQRPPASPRARPHSLSFSGLPEPLALPAPGRLLSIGGLRPDIPVVSPGEGPPPPSPLLEAYHGTYQSISPMPFPTHLPDDDIDDLSLLSPRVSNPSVNRYAMVRHRREPSGSSTLRSPSRDNRSHSRNRRSPSRSSRRSPSRDRRSPSYSPPLRQGARDHSRSPPGQKRVTMYDAERDAKDIAESLSRSNPRMDALIEILPTLSHDQVMDLRLQYKRVCKVQGHGINIAKHIKLKASGNVGKIAYVTALGRWEGEGYWANFWYQSNSAKRELLIESLMGRTNSDIRAIKDAFKDKRYGDSLSRCMDKELKADKFRKAILMALEERRQEEDQMWPREYIDRDVDTLYEALRRREGGESAIIEIVVTRSDRHLRECLRQYERRYEGNFAKDALRKSNNLVGEIVAHILNGVINRPSRDAMLLHHALEDLTPNPAAGDSKHDRKDRYELLISRLVRLHWDRLHLVRVKQEYREKYRIYLEEDIEHYITNEDFADFCLGLCEVKER